MSYYTDSDDFNGPEGMEKVIAVLTTGHLDIHGGYPYGFEIHAGKVFIASLDDGKERQRTCIDVYDENEMRAWEKRARQFREEWPDESWDVCVYETQGDCLVSYCHCTESIHCGIGSRWL